MSTPIEEEEEEVEEIGDEGDDYTRRKRAAARKKKNNGHDEPKRSPRADDRRRLREQNDELKRTVKLAKEAGHAVEYKGHLNRAAFVSVFWHKSVFFGRQFLSTHARLYVVICYCDVQGSWACAYCS